MSIEPVKIAAGDSLSWTRALTDYPAGDGWTLHYALFNAIAAYSFASTPDGDAHQVDVPSATTEAWAPGRYDYTAYVTHTDGTRRSLFAGVLTITPNPAAGTPHDGRTHARKMLDAIEATIEGRASKHDLDLVRGQFGERAAERAPEKLIEWRDKYRAEVDAEERAAAIARGERRPRNIKARFGR